MNDEAAMDEGWIAAAEVAGSLGRLAVESEPHAQQASVWERGLVGDSLVSCACCVEALIEHALGSLRREC
jgi:hypothetical protein